MTDPVLLNITMDSSSVWINVTVEVMFSCFLFFCINRMFLKPLRICLVQLTNDTSKASSNSNTRNDCKGKRARGFNVAATHKYGTLGTKWLFYDCKIRTY